MERKRNPEKPGGAECAPAAPKKVINPGIQTVFCGADYIENVSPYFTIWTLLQPFVFR